MARGQHQCDHNVWFLSFGEYLFGSDVPSGEHLRRGRSQTGMPEECNFLGDEEKAHGDTMP